MNYDKLLYILKNKPWSFLFVFWGYILFNELLNKTHVIFKRLYIDFNFLFSTAFIFINFLFVPLLVSLTLNLSFDKIKDLKYVIRSSGVFSFLGLFGVLLGGACPSCFIGLFPAVVGLLGLGFTLYDMPFHGLEIQILSSIVLIISLHYLTRDTTCILKKSN